MLSSQLPNNSWPLNNTFLLNTHLLLIIDSQIRSWRFQWMMNGCQTDHGYLKLLKSSQLLFLSKQISHYLPLRIVCANNAPCNNFIIRFLLSLAWQQLSYGLCEIDSESNYWNEKRLPVWLISLVYWLMDNNLPLYGIGEPAILSNNSKKVWFIAVFGLQWDLFIMTEYHQTYHVSLYIRKLKIRY